jgi:hypothetical protein
MDHAPGLPSERSTPPDDHRLASPPRLPAPPRRDERHRASGGIRVRQLSRGERALWASSYPDEVPLVNGELPWIALVSADLD